MLSFVCITLFNLLLNKTNLFGHEKLWSVAFPVLVCAFTYNMRYMILTVPNKNTLLIPLKHFLNFIIFLTVTNQWVQTVADKEFWTTGPNRAIPSSPRVKYSLTWPLYYSATAACRLGNRQNRPSSSITYDLNSWCRMQYIQNHNATKYF